MIRSLRAAVLAAVVIVAACRPAAAPAPARAVRILLVNDVYVGDTLRDGSGGVARVAALRDSLQRAGGDRVLFVLAGDVLSPSLLSKWYAGRQMIDVFNAARLDYATFGNHEFELPRDTLLDRVRRSRFRWLSANCTLADGAPFPTVRPWDTVTVNGTRVGLFGVTLTGDYRSYVRCTDPDSAAARATTELRAAGAQLVVALTHQTIAADSALLARERRIDVVLGGHEHEVHEVVIDGRHLVKADANARSAQLLGVTRTGTQWTQTTTLFPMGRGAPLDAATAAAARAWTDTLRRRLGEERVLATAPAEIDGRDAVSRSRESPLGDIVADAIRAGTGADVALINSGALRLDDVIGPGPITNYQLESVFLFADETRVVTFPLTGARLRALLEHAVSDGVYGHGGFLQLSGITFRYDPRRPSGARVVEGSLRRADGRPIDVRETLRTAFVAYPACAGGDGYAVPEAASACRTAAVAPRTVDLVARHVAAVPGGRLVVPPAGRIVREGAPAR